MPMTAFIGVRISWLIVARKGAFRLRGLLRLPPRPHQLAHVVVDAEIADLLSPATITGPPSTATSTRVASLRIRRVLTPVCGWWSSSRSASARSSLEFATRSLSLRPTASSRVYPKSFSAAEFHDVTLESLSVTAIALGLFS